MRWANFARRRLLRENHPDFRAIARWLSVGRVVHLQFEYAARFQPDCRTRRHDLRIRARGVGREYPARWKILTCGMLVNTGSFLRESRLRVHFECRRARHVWGRAVVDEHVMDDLAVARTY